MDTALKQAINLFLKSKNALTGKGKGLQKTPIKQARAGKGTKPIGSFQNGSILMSDGTLQQTDVSNQHTQKLKTLRDNVFSQHNFTPQAENFLRSIPLNSFVRPGSLGTYFEDMAPAIGTSIDPYKEVIVDEKRKIPRHIGISPNVFKGHPTLPAEVLTHEFMHALDANINAPTDASYIPYGQTSGDSYDFYNNLGNSSTKDQVFNSIKQFLNSYPSDQYTQDYESYAQYAAPRGNKTLLNKEVRNKYENVFVPANKHVNSTPTYPTRDLFNDLVSKLFDEEVGEDY